MEEHTFSRAWASLKKPKKQLHALTHLPTPQQKDMDYEDVDPQALLVTFDKCRVRADGTVDTHALTHWLRLEVGAPSFVQMLEGQGKASYTRPEFERLVFRHGSSSTGGSGGPTTTSNSTGTAKEKEKKAKAKTKKPVAAPRRERLVEEEIEEAAAHENRGASHGPPPLTPSPVATQYVVSTSKKKEAGSKAAAAAGQKERKTATIKRHRYYHHHQHDNESEEEEGEEEVEEGGGGGDWRRTTTTKTTSSKAKQQQQRRPSSPRYVPHHRKPSQQYIRDWSREHASSMPAWMRDGAHEAEQEEEDDEDDYSQHSDEEDGRGGYTHRWQHYRNHRRLPPTRYDQRRLRLSRSLLPPSSHHFLSPQLAQGIRDFFRLGSPPKKRASSSSTYWTSCRRRTPSGRDRYDNEEEEEEAEEEEDEELPAPRPRHYRHHSSHHHHHHHAHHAGKETAPPPPPPLPRPRKFFGSPTRWATSNHHRRELPTPSHDDVSPRPYRTTSSSSCSSPTKPSSSAATAFDQSLPWGGMLVPRRQEGEEEEAITGHTYWRKDSDRPVDPALQAVMTGLDHLSGTARPRLQGLLQTAQDHAVSALANATRAQNRILLEGSVEMWAPSRSLGGLLMTWVPFHLVLYAGTKELRIYQDSVPSAWGVIPLHEKGALELRLLEKIECPTDATWQGRRFDLIVRTSSSAEVDAKYPGLGVFPGDEHRASHTARYNFRAPTAQNRLLWVSLVTAVVDAETTTSGGRRALLPPPPPVHHLPTQQLDMTTTTAPIPAAASTLPVRAAAAPSTPGAPPPPPPPPPPAPVQQQHQPALAATIGALADGMETLRLTSRAPLRATYSSFSSSPTGGLAATTKARTTHRLSSTASPPPGEGGGGGGPPAGGR